MTSNQTANWVIFQTQHKVEMDKRDGMFGPQPVMAVPPVQQMSRIDQPIPPSVGYPPQGYGQPYGYPPQAQGYPAAGYPPPAYPPSNYPPPGYPPSGYPKWSFHCDKCWLAISDNHFNVASIGLEVIKRSNFRVECEMGNKWAGSYPYFACV